VHRHLIPEFGQLNLADISLGRVNEWQVGLLADVTPATVLRVRATLGSILQQAVREGVLERNIVSLADAPGIVQPRERWLSNEELRVLLEAADAIEAEGETIKQPNYIGGWVRDFVLWCLHSGMRRQEILDLTFDHIQEVPGGFQVTIEKSKSGRSRAIACNDTMVEVIQRLRAMKRSSDDRRLFPVSSITVKRALAKLWRRSGLQDVRLHDLRRTHATQLAYANVDLRTLASRLGHRDLAMLEKHYAMAVEDRKAAHAAQQAFSFK
jgi:integrase